MPYPAGLCATGRFFVSLSRSAQYVFFTLKNNSGAAVNLHHHTPFGAQRNRR